MGSVDYHEQWYECVDLQVGDKVYVKNMSNLCRKFDNLIKHEWLQNSVEQVGVVSAISENSSGLTVCVRFSTGDEFLLYPHWLKVLGRV